MAVRYPIVIYPDGTYHVLNASDTLFGVGSSGSGNLFIQSTPPTVDPGVQYLWIQTEYGDADGFTFWFEDGIS